jgi:hypothetical protein
VAAGGRVYAVGAAARWHGRRNTSGITPVEPGALKAATEALDRLHYDQPALVQWIADGYPTMTEAEHVERFGEPYDAGAREHTPERPAQLDLGIGTC